MRSLLLAGLAVGLATSAVATQTTPIEPDIDEATYKAFMVEARSEQVSVFIGLSAQDKARLGRTHLRRWIAANKSDLTSEQSKVLGEALALISAELYQEPRNAELQARLKALGERAETLLGMERAAYAMRARGPYIPPAKK